MKRENEKERERENERRRKREGFATRRFYGITYVPAHNSCSHS